MMTIFSPLSGKLSDKIGTRILCSAGMGIMALGLILLIFLIIYLPITFIILSLSILGVGIGLFSSPNQSAIMKSVEKKDLGIASGTLSTMRVVGQSVSVALLSAILVIFIPSTILNPILSLGSIAIDATIKSQFLSGMLASFVAAIIICILGALIAIIRGKEQI
jgi:MFS family permease